MSRAGNDRQEQQREEGSCEGKTETFHIDHENPKIVGTRPSDATPDRKSDALRRLEKSKSQPQTAPIGLERWEDDRSAQAGLE